MQTSIHRCQGGRADTRRSQQWRIDPAHRGIYWALCCLQDTCSPLDTARYTLTCFGRLWRRSSPLNSCRCMRCCWCHWYCCTGQPGCVPKTFQKCQRNSVRVRRLAAVTSTRTLTDEHLPRSARPRSRVAIKPHWAQERAVEGASRTVAASWTGRWRCGVQPAVVPRRTHACAVAEQ